MSGIGPLGFSFSSSFMQSYLMRTHKDAKGPRKVKGGNRGIMMVGYALLRIILGVDSGLIFELIGGFVLSQTKFKRYDFRTHKNADAIVFIGCIGGLVIGLLLILIDYTIGNMWRVRDGPVMTAPQADWSDEHKREVPHIITVRNQAAVRALIWPGLGAVGSIVGTLLWHLHQNDRPGKHPEERTTTAAIVGVVGASIVVSAPSLVQLIIISVAGDAVDK